MVRRRFWQPLILVLCLGAANPGPVVAAPDAETPAKTSPMGSWLESNPVPNGRWITKNHDAVIQIAPCGPNLCGRIVGMALAPGEPVPKDWQGASQCGLTIIQTKPGTDGDGNPIWQGTVLDPRDGSTYHARLKLDEAHKLQLRGYIGLPMFGETQTWTPFDGRNIVNCRITPG